MKFLIVIAFVFLCASATQADEDSDTATMRALAQDCKKTEKATDADVEKFINGEEPETAEGICLVGKVQAGKASHNLLTFLDL
jgi:hypothetical protein